MDLASLINKENIDPISQQSNNQSLYYKTCGQMQYKDHQVLQQQNSSNYNNMSCINMKQPSPDFYQIFRNQETRQFLIKYFMKFRHQIPIDLFVQKVMEDNIYDNHEQPEYSYEVLDNVQQKLKEMLTDDKDQRLVSFKKLSRWTNEAGLMGLITACIKKYFLDSEVSSTNNSVNISSANNINNNNWNNVQCQCQSQDLQQMLFEFCQFNMNVFSNEIEQKLQQLEAKEHKIQNLLKIVNDKISHNYSIIQVHKKLKEQNYQLQRQNEMLHSFIQEKEQLIQQQQLQLQNQQRQLEEIQQNKQQNEPHQLYLLEKTVDFVQSVSRGIVNHPECNNNPLYTNMPSYLLASDIEQIYSQGFQVLLCILEQEQMVDRDTNWNCFLQLFYKLSLFFYDLKFRRDSRSLQKDSRLKQLLDYQIKEYSDEQDCELLYTLNDQQQQNQNYELIFDNNLQQHLVGLLKQQTIKLHSLIIEMLNGEYGIQEIQEIVSQKSYYIMLLMIFSNECDDYSLAINSVIKDLEIQDQFKLELNSFFVDNQMVTLVMHCLKKTVYLDINIVNDNNDKDNNDNDNSYMINQNSCQNQTGQYFSDVCNEHKDYPTSQYEFYDSVLQFLRNRQLIGCNHHGFLKQIKSVRNIEVLMYLLETVEDPQILINVLEVLRNITHYINLHGSLFAKISHKMQHMRRQIMNNSQEGTQQFIDIISSILDNLQKNNNNNN